MSALVAFAFGILFGIVAAYALFIAALLVIGQSAPRILLHRHAARSLNQALADYFGTREIDENDALLVRLRAAAGDHYEALVELDHADTKPREEPAPVMPSPVA